MAVDLFANNAQTTLAAGIAAGATSLTVASSALFPAVTTAAATQFRVLIDFELFLVTNVTGTTWTVTPGVEGTAQAAHAANAPVTAILTAAALSSRPAGTIPLSVAGQTPQPDGTAAIGTISAAARTDHVHPVAGLIEWFGDALDGDLNFNGSAVTWVAAVPNDTGAGTLTATANVYTLNRDVYCRNLTVAATYTINTAGFRVFATGTATVNGTISHSGKNATIGTAGAATAGGGQQTALALGGPGAAGGTGVGVQGGSPQAFTSAGSNGAGGSGGAGAGGAVNSGGQQPAINYERTVAHQALSAFFGALTYYNTNNIYSGANTSVQLIEGGRGGSSGAGDATNSGGGGGGAGGVCIVNARYLTGSGSIAANGGSGGTVTVGNCGGGGGGSGGACLVNTSDAAGVISGLPAWTGTVTANGGTGGAGVGTGTAGGAAAVGIAFLTTWK